MSKMVEQLEIANQTVENYQEGNRKVLLEFKEEREQELEKVKASSQNEIAELEKSLAEEEKNSISKLQVDYEKRINQGKENLKKVNSKIEDTYYEEVIGEVVKRYGRM